MPLGAWKASWVMDGRPTTTQEMGEESDHSSSCDGVGDSVTDVESTANEPSSSESEPTIPLCWDCGQSDPTFLNVCSRCEDTICDKCKDECVGCEVPMCTACEAVCVKCEDLYEMRSIHVVRRSHHMLEYEIKSPSDFQEFLDRVSVYKGVDLEMEHRGEDGIERWPPLEPLPMFAEDGQHLIDDYVKKVPVLASLNRKRG